MSHFCIMTLTTMFGILIKHGKYWRTKQRCTTRNALATCHHSIWMCAANMSGRQLYIVRKAILIKSLNSKDEAIIFYLLTRMPSTIQRYPPSVHYYTSLSQRHSWFQSLAMCILRTINLAPTISIIRMHVQSYIKESKGASIKWAQIRWPLTKNVNLETS